MLRSFLYLVPRALLFGIFVLCFLVTIFVSLDYLLPSENPLEVLMTKTVRGVRDFTLGEWVKKKGG
jgi:hypothetical protein